MSVSLIEVRAREVQPNPAHTSLISESSRNESEINPRLKLAFRRS